MHLSIRVLAPRHRNKQDDLLNQVFPTMEKIMAASTMCMLPLLESKIDQIAAYYHDVKETPYWVNWLANGLLHRRCELLTLWYPENEEA